MMARAANSESGSALVMALMLVFVVGAMTSSMVSATRLLSRDTVSARGAISAFHAAEGGLERARWQLGRDPAYAGEQLVVGEARVTIRVERTAGSEDGWRVRTVARCRPRGQRGSPVQRTLEARLVATSGLPAVAGWRLRR